MRFTTVSVPLRDLHRPEEYQRETDLRRARRMASLYDPIQFQPLTGHGRNPGMGPDPLSHL